jgi:hypothetical protein
VCTSLSSRIQKILGTKCLQMDTHSPGINTITAAVAKHHFVPWRDVPRKTSCFVIGRRPWFAYSILTDVFAPQPVLPFLSKKLGADAIIFGQLQVVPSLPLSPSHSTLNLNLLSVVICGFVHSVHSQKQMAVHSVHSHKQMAVHSHIYRPEPRHCL